MPITVSPRQLQQRANLYHQLAQLSAAGVTLVSALELVERHPPARSDRAPLARVRQSILHGSSFTDGLLATGRWLPAFDVALLHAGEQSGRLPDCFKLLADHYTGGARLARQVFADLAYPLLVVHVAVFLLPFPEFFASGNTAAYLAKTIGGLAPFYLLVLFFVFALQGRHGFAWRAWVERVLHPVPWLGSARRAMALARLAAALESLLSAGVSILQAWPIAALACGSPALIRAVASFEPRWAAGEPPGDTLSQSRGFPEVFSSLYHSGEISGKLDESLRHLHQLYQEEGTRKMHLVARWGPQLFYFVVAFFVAMKVIAFYRGLGAAWDNL
jgi:type II secretory pathway component PulF